MARVIGVFQTQSDADAAMEELARFDADKISTAVYEGVSQDHPTGADTMAGGDRPGPAGIPIPVPATGGRYGVTPFASLGLGLGAEDDEEYLRQMYENGATLVVVEGEDQFVEQARRVLNQHGGRFSKEN